MCIPPRLFSLVLTAALTGCGGSLTLPDDGSPAALRVVSGDGQQGTVGSRLDDPLVVKLTDGGSRPIAEAPVVFQFTSDVPDAEVDPEQAATDSNGVASARVRLGTSTGPLLVEARVVSPAVEGLSATFGLTALAREHGKNDKGGGHGGKD